jgi:hypothetical protein
VTLRLCKCKGFKPGELQIMMIMIMIMLVTRSKMISGDCSYPIVLPVWYPGRGPRPGSVTVAAVYLKMALVQVTATATVSDRDRHWHGDRRHAGRVTVTAVLRPIVV